LKAEEFLKQYKTQQTIIASCWEEFEMWKGIALSITGHTEGERVQSCGSKQKMADAVISYSDIEADIKQRVAEAKAIQNEIVRKIAQLPEPEYYVLHGVYILGKQYKQVAASRNPPMSKSWATSVHGNALVHLQRLLDAENKECIKV
jgi:DNA-directed RNA polymerase specialized sigma subunit